MVTDFFYPNMGGVESHVYFLSQQLVQRGHKVVIVTHAYNDRIGIRHLSSGVKVYYLTIPVLHNQCTLPNYLLLFPTLHQIIQKEEINIVHGHQAFSSMAHEALMHARTMGIECVFTDHSLFGFSDMSSILTNKLFKFSMIDVSKIICVSNTSKENTVLRARCAPENVYVIPNAIDASSFLPDPTKRPTGRIRIIVMSRLVYRKGTDLLVQVIPQVCSLFPQVEFIIGGDGPKKVDLEQMRENHSIQERVKLIGAVRNENVRDTLVTGHIFLNTSLTEAFCIAIVEAVCCGYSLFARLIVVSTAIGGIPEVLPDEMILLTQTNSSDIVCKIGQAIEQIQEGRIDSYEMHRKIEKMYSWEDVAERTERVIQFWFISCRFILHQAQTQQMKL